jgi:preprotein translocase subunit YajC
MTSAWAQAKDVPTTGDVFMQLVPFALIILIMWVLLIRPQQKRARAHQDMIKSVQRGDMVITSGGLVAKVTRVIDDNELDIELSDGVKARLMRRMIADVRTKGEPRS